MKGAPEQQLTNTGHGYEPQKLFSRLRHRAMLDARFSQLGL